VRERERDHQGLREEWAGLPAPGASAEPCSLSRGGADGARRPTPGDWPRFPEYVVARRYAVSGTALCQSVWVSRPTVPRIVSPEKITVKGARYARVNSLRSPLTVIFPGKTIGTCQLDGAFRRPSVVSVLVRSNGAERGLAG